MNPPLKLAEEVRAALAAGGPVVALETSVVAQGLPPPHNLEAARRCADAVRAPGAVPAAVAVIAGEVVVGADAAALERLADPARRPAKASPRDLAALCAAGRDAGTTVAATAAVAALAGIRVFATGGIGGVHRLAPGEPATGAADVSADLAELARAPVCVVSAGPKAILDLAATAEALETLGVPVLGWRTSELPAFYSDGSGIALEHRVEDAAAAARVLRLHWDVLRRREGVLLVVPPPEAVAREVVEAAIAAALQDARARAIRGKAVTPFLLEAVSRATRGRARAANLALLERNAAVAGEVAVALAAAAR
ncbi:pseudouridine-5'-phosphate glycosidase [Anaeromyxobacter dehalogenans]|uniref:Pseudouridine-5'-phosphate glycosidase n=1 Tax=Anaeromyxobacter dehalogenans (strain 2CP-C) TaxID=290397 RepID=Q2II95_ANADE|nr:pseudouridine-5'-phosphate glycosidase [Anaeromyxobacter dehalogenans]ABC81374.1 Indigoidine synthase A like protein [Anaeromyxobacter dehalogenans 2CP-C]